jgi:hypothetical protein
MGQNNNNNNQNTDPSKDPAIILILGLVGMAVYSTKQLQIKNWLYDNMIGLILLGLFALIALGLYVRYRIQNKNKDSIRRHQSLKSMRPSNRPMDYYSRRRPDDER